MQVHQSAPLKCHVQSQALRTSCLTKRIVRTRVATEGRVSSPLIAEKKQGVVEIPESLRNSVLVLDAPNVSGSTTKVYIMGVSHVSKIQAEQVKELIHAVRPDVVMLELCKDRTGLLADNRLETPEFTRWHVRKVAFEGLPTEPEWPTAADLKKLLVTRSGRPVAMADIEGDVFTLQSTGLFKSVRPGAASASYDDAPHFSVSLAGADGSAQIQTVPPLGGVRFMVQPRELPPITEFSVRVDSSLMGMGVDEAKLVEIAETAINEVRDGAAPLLVLLRARGKFAEVVGGSVAVSTAFSGVESGCVEAIIKTVKPTDRPYVSGFESGAVDGEGWGIETFRPTRPLHKLGNKFFLPAKTLEELRDGVRSIEKATEAVNAAAVSSSGQSSIVDIEPSTHFKLWTDEELGEAKRADPEPVPLADTFRDIMILLYSKYQGAIATKVGVERGAAWQAAMLAATEVGCQQVVLADRPNAVTERRLGDNLVQGAGARLAGAVAVVIGSIIGAVVADYPLEMEIGGVGVGIMTSLALLWPVVGPILEIQRLAAMDPADIEEAVRVKQPLAAEGASGKVFGEDALLDWPGATGPLLDDRDEFMARAAANVAAGSQEGLCPAYVLDRVEGQLIWRLMQAEGAPAESSPSGFGDGMYKPLPGVRSVVSIVGTAHVPGIAKRWSQAVKAPTDVQALLWSPKSEPVTQPDSKQD